MVDFAAAHRFRDGVSFFCPRSASWFAQEAAQNREMYGSAGRPEPALYAIRPGIWRIQAEGLSQSVFSSAPVSATQKRAA
jgi:hypothetical protein